MLIKFSHFGAVFGVGPLGMEDAFHRMKIFEAVVAIYEFVRLHGGASLTLECLA